DHVYASGTIIANEEAELKAEASGTITYIHLPEGKFVKAGTLLLKVNDADLRAQFDKLNIQLKLAEQNELRQRKLLQINGISQQDYDIIRANLYSLKADSAFHQAQITKTEIRAPFDGVIGIRNVSLGSYLTPAITVAQIHQIDPVKIDFTLPEKYSSLFKEGENIHFKTEGSVTDYTAKIFVKDPKVDINSRSVRYRARVNNQDKQLSPGAFVRIELSLHDNRSALFVTTEAVIPVLKGKKVYVIKDGLAEERMVETGLRTEDHVQILSGLVAGDSVAVNGNFQLKQGSSVKVVGSSQK
ncbi:MAG: efflux RND transporter periplasmic adaptor subunit, partial [Cytophagales bacterium]|nr:efflux RND transporter periplasmic adaptor subunit [Cytophaga sp.]